MPTVTLTTTVELLDGSEHDVEIEVGIWGRHRRATMEDPEEFPEAEIRSVKLIADGLNALGLPMLGGYEIPIESIKEDSLGDWEHDALREASELAEPDWD